MARGKIYLLLSKSSNGLLMGSNFVLFVGKSLVFDFLKCKFVSVVDLALKIQRKKQEIC